MVLVFLLFLCVFILLMSFDRNFEKMSSCVTVRSSVGWQRAHRFQRFDEISSLLAGNQGIYYHGYIILTLFVKGFSSYLYVIFIINSNVI